MNPINFGQAAWPTLAANQIIRVDNVVKTTGKVFNIVLGKLVVAHELLEGDPQLVLARKIAAGLPANLKAVADQAWQYSQPVASRMAQDPDADPRSNLPQTNVSPPTGSD